MQIDVTELATLLEQDAASYAVEAVYQAAASTWFGAWLRIPFLGSLLKRILERIFKIAFKAAVMQAFFFNTAVRKAGQASAYLNVVEALKLPAVNPSVAKYLEQKKMEAFKDLVMVTR